MSSLSNSVETMLVDFTVLNAERCEFRLPEGFLASSIRLADFGVYDAQQTSGTTGLQYPQILGVLACAKKISLFSGGVPLDETSELAALASISNLLTSNSAAEDINRFELLNSTNLSVNTDDAYSLMPDLKDYNLRYNNPTTREIGGIQHGNRLKLATAQGNTSGMVSLDNFLGLLKSVPVLPDIPDLRLIIEWNTSASLFFQDPDAPTQVAAPSYTPLRPTLIVDKLRGMPPRAADVKLPFISTLVEPFPVPETAVDTQTRSSFRSGAFKNRFVKDFTFFNKVTADDGSLRAAERSPAMREEILQLYINGSSYLPDQGIVQESQKLQYFNDTHGSLNLPMAAFLQGITDTSGHIISNADHNTHPSSNLVHNFSVTAVRVNDTIQDFKIEYTRRGGALTAQASEFTLLCIGRVARELEIKGNSVRLSY